MIVVDVNILAFYIIQGQRTSDARALRELDAEWIVPAFWCIEFQSILWKYARHGGMRMETALDLLEKAIDLFSANEATPSPDMVLRNALVWGVTVYDAQYVTLAKQFGVRCVTEDVQLQKACPHIAASLREYICPSYGDNIVRELAATYTTNRSRKVRK